MYINAPLEYTLNLWRFLGAKRTSCAAAAGLLMGVMDNVGSVGKRRRRLRLMAATGR